MGKSPAERKRDQRAREKAARESEQSAAEQMAVALRDHDLNLAWAQEQDEKDFFYKSECRSCVDLLGIYEGVDINAKESEDDDEDIAAEKKKKDKDKKTKQVRPNPYLDKLSIRAISYVDNGVEVKFDPDQWEYETLTGEKINLRKHYEVDAIVSFRRWLDLRDKARKNLFWLCNLVGMSMYHGSHQVICDMFVQKNFDGMYFPGFNKLDVSEMINRQKRVAQDGVTPTKTMMLFAPRSGRKSTIDSIDAVQWMLNCPDARIMVATAFRDLAKQLFGEIKAYFNLPQFGTPTPFQILFPEYVLYGRAGSSDSPIKCPAATLPSKEPHVWKTSMESSSTGKRCDIRKLDDPVDYVNSNTEELRETLERKIGATADLTEPWGFTDVIGTRYFTKDWYGTRMNKDADGNDPEPYAFLSISAWTPKPGFETLYNQLLKEPNGMYKVTKDMVDIWFPGKLSYEVLVSRLKEKKEISFKNQQLNVATDPKEVDNYINQFDIDVLRAHQYDKSMMPKDMDIIQCWDIAYSENGRTSDYSVGVTLGIYKTKKGELAVVVIEVFFDKWKASELASNFIKYYEKYRPSKVYVENANGVNFLSENILNYAKLHASDIGQALRLRPVSSKANAKRERIKDLEFLLGHDRLWFVSGAWIDETYKQLTEYKGGKSTAYRKDDIPDAISLGVVSHLPITALQHNPDPKDVEKEYEDRMKKAKLADAHRRMFGGQSTRKNPVASPPPVTQSQWMAMHSGQTFPTPPTEPAPPAPVYRPRPIGGGSFARLPNGMRDGLKGR